MEENKQSNEMNKDLSENVFLDYYDEDEAKLEEAVPKKKEKSITYEILTWIRDLGIIIIVVLFVTTFVGEKTRVKGDSMEPNIHDGDNLILNKVTYRFSEPERFDIVVFPYEKDPSLNYIKRIIGLPGEEVNLRDGKIFINGELLEENYGMEEIRIYGNQGFPDATLIVPEDEYFVMGDNRNDSSDSRYKDVGTISKEEFLGKTWIRIWPLTDFGVVE